MYSSLTNTLLVMLSKTSLFHLDKLKPTSVQEADQLLNLLEHSLLLYVTKTGLCDLYNIKEIYCNRKHVHFQRDLISYPIGNQDATAEYYYLNVSIEKFVESIIDNYYAVKNTTVFSQLNLECCLVNKANIALSYDLY